MSVDATHPDDVKMSLMEHLGELRTRLVRVTVAVLVLGLGSLLFARELYGLLMRPVLLALPPGSASLVFTSAIEEINVLMKIGLYAGIFLSTPVLLWQIWSFVAPGLYPDERKLAGPFIVFGTLAFLAGALFCYLVLLPQMFQFLLQKEDATAMQRRLDTGRLREEDALRYLRLGQPELAGVQARGAAGDLEAPGDGETTDRKPMFSIVPRPAVDAAQRLAGLGRLIDAARDGLPPAEHARLLPAMEARVAAVKAWGEQDFDAVARHSDDAAAVLASAWAPRAGELEAVWHLERLLAVGQARTESLNWTRPMLSMNEQLTLVLILELAFGLIFELPLVMMVLGMVGLVTSKFLFTYQRHAFVVNLIVAAIITPTGDAVNLALMAGPMMACYQLGVLLVWLVERRRAKQAAAAQA
jgi:sec-independent protein translocase protein TatC